jgi:hypothetical protein
LEVTVENVSGSRLPWTGDVAADIDLVGPEGVVYPASEVGGTLAESVVSGFPADGVWRGWLVFPVADFATYCLRYPGQPQMRLVLTAEEYRLSAKEYFDSIGKEPVPTPTASTASC